MKRKQTNGLFLILPNKNPFVKRRSFRSFASHYTEFGTPISLPPHHTLDFTTELLDGNTYTYTYSFPPWIPDDPFINPGRFWFEQVARDFVFFNPNAAVGGEAFNFSVRNQTPIKSL
jgi:hypothetical protein